MRNLKKSLLVLLVACPTILSFSCLGDAFWRTMRDAAVVGAADWVEDSTFTYLDENVSILDGAGDAAE